MATDLGTINIQKNFQVDPIKAQQMFAQKRALLDAQNQRRAASIDTGMENPYQAYKDHPFLMGLSTLAMGLGEGMTGRPFLTNFNNNLYEQKQAQLKYKQWQEEQNLAKRKLELEAQNQPLNNFLKNAEVAGKMYEMGLITKEQLQSSLGRSGAPQPQVPVSGAPITMRGGMEDVVLTGGKTNKFGVFEPEYGLSPEKKGQMAGIEAAEKEKAAGVSKVKDTSRVMKNFFNDLNMVHKELSSEAPASLEKGGKGILSRMIEVPYKKLSGELSQTKATSSRMSKIVYPMAKSYDPGGRLAKDDITAFADVLGVLGNEASSDVAVKAAKELRDLRQVMNDKGADGDRFVNDFLSQAQEQGGFYNLIVDEFSKEQDGVATKKPVGLTKEEEAELQMLEKKYGGR